MIDKNISVWRGNLTPPTQYHLWLKEDKLYHYNGEEWVENQIDQATSKNDGLMSKEDKNRLDNLVYDNLDSEDSSKALSANQGRILLKKIRDLNISAYKVKGSVDNITDIFSFDSEIGDVYNIINSFELEGKEYPAGTNVVWTGDRWDPLGGTIDLNDYSTTEQIEDLLNQYKNEVEESLDSYTINGKKISSNPVINKQDVGLNNVTNDIQVKRDEMGVSGGVATLNESGKVPINQLPVVTATSDGIMSSQDKQKLENKVDKVDGKSLVLDSEIAKLNSLKSQDQITQDINSIKTTIDNYTINGKRISSNPTITKEDINLTNVDNTADIDKPVSTLQAQAIKTVQDNVDLHTQDKNNPHEVTKEQIGLNNVNNVKQIPYSEKGAINGVATLNQYGSIPINQIPYTFAVNYEVIGQSTSQWIRIAILNTTTSSGIISIINEPTNNRESSVILNVSMSSYSGHLSVSQIGGITILFSKCRLVYSNTKSYLEIYYTSTLNNVIHVNAVNFINGSLIQDYTIGSIPENYNSKEFVLGSGNVANQLTPNTNIGNLTKPIFFENGIPKECSHTLGASVPTNAKFTDTTYDVVTATKNGLMSSQDKVNLDIAIDDIEIIKDDVNIIEETKAGKDELSNILGEEVINQPLLEEINTVTREEIKKDLFIDLWVKGYDCQYDGTKEKPFTCNTVELTYDEAIAVYNTPRFMQYNSGQFSLLNPMVKTIILGLDRAMGRIEDIRNTFRTPSLVAVRVCIDNPNQITYSPYTDISYAFYGCTNLKKILGIIGFESQTANKTDKAFGGCKALEEVKIYHLRSDVSFHSSPLLSFQSLDYIVTNAANSNAITITVHSNVYAKLTDETNIEWNTLLNTAAEKNISFATV